VIKKANEKKVPFVVTSQCLNGATEMHVYEVGNEALKLGSVQSYDMSLECTAVKLMWAIKHYSYEEIPDAMHTNFVGELSKERKRSFHTSF